MRWAPICGIIGETIMIWLLAEKTNSHSAKMIRYGCELVLRHVRFTIQPGKTNHETSR